MAANVVESLEATLWCYVIKQNYREAILKAPNWGHDVSHP